MPKTAARLALPFTLRGTERPRNLLDTVRPSNWRLVRLRRVGHLALPDGLR